MSYDSDVVNSMVDRLVGKRMVGECHKAAHTLEHMEPLVPGMSVLLLCPTSINVEPSHRMLYLQVVKGLTIMISDSKQL